MTAQMYYMQTRQERSERTMMECERKDTQHHLYNVELRSQLDDKDIERTLIDDEYTEEIQRLHSENETLRCRIGLTAIDLARKEHECSQLRQEISDNICILDYVENQKKEMLDILMTVDNSDPIRQYIDLYITDYV